MKLIRFIIYGNILVSLSVGSLTFGTSIFQQLDHSILYGVCSFFATLFIYNLQRLMRFEDVKTQDSNRHRWIIQHKTSLISLSAIGLFGATTTYLFLGIGKDYILLGALTILGFLYAYQIKGKSAVREIPFLKIYLIAVVWTLVTVFWPSYREEMLGINIIFLITSVGFYIIAATIPFDIRDLLYDHSSQKTIPQLVGVNGSKWIGIVLLIISAFLLFMTNSLFYQNPLSYLAYIGMGILILYSHNRRPEMYFSGLIDGWIIFFGLQFLL